MAEAATLKIVIADDGSNAKSPSSRPPAGEASAGTARELASGKTSAGQRRVAAAVFIYLRGSAKRAGTAIPPPRLITVNGVEAIPANRLDRNEGFEHGAQFNAGQTPIFYANWNLRYMLPTLPPGQLPLPPNPFAGDNDGGG